ncbi:MAG: hypothetical protein WBQ02_05920, partial [Terracidiphilus sp.]
LGENDGDSVSEIEVGRIREGLASGCLLRPHPNVALGSLVRVLKGVFQGAAGVVTEFRRQCKVVMTLSATKQCFSLEVDLADLEVIRRPAVGTTPGLNREVVLARV